MVREPPPKGGQHSARPAAQTPGGDPWYRPSTIDDMKRRKTSSPSCPPALSKEADRRPIHGPAAEGELALFAKAASHPIRVKILHMLAQRDAQMCCHIVDELPLAQSTVSEHLRILRSAGLVKANEEGPRAGYCIVPSALKRFKALLNGV